MFFQGKLSVSLPFECIAQFDLPAWERNPYGSTVPARQGISPFCLIGRNFVAEAYTALSSGVTLDAVGILCENALDRLYELNGENVSEAVIDQVFKRFCVGK